jgi:pimeloyl-ACP methyl ester carboxylesterase
VAGAIVVGASIRETGVAVVKVSTQSGTSPPGIEGLLSRIPRADPDMPQVRIERYEGAGGASDAFVVYLGGTIDAALMATDEPWDMTSNLSALAAMDAGSYRAAVEAMRLAGIGPDDIVTLVGHSQGGLLAARIAQSQDFHVGDVVTVGAPIHQIHIPDAIRVTAIEHTEDLVPTLGGVTLGGIELGGAALLGSAFGGATPAAASVTTVRRSALNGRPVDPTDSLPGHNLSRYIETGRVMDASASPQVTALKSRLAAGTSGTPTVTLWRAERN